MATAAIDSINHQILIAVHYMKDLKKNTTPNVSTGGCKALDQVRGQGAGRRKNAIRLRRMNIFKKTRNTAIGPSAGF